MLGKIFDGFKNFFKFFSFDAWLVLIFVSYALYLVKMRFFLINFYYWFMMPVVLVLIIIYVVYDVISRQKECKSKDTFTPKKIIIVLVLISVFFLGNFFVAIEKVPPPIGLFTHDEILETKYAMKYISEGKNPYHENYYHTTLNTAPNFTYINVFNEKTIPNPGLVTYAYLPTQFLAPLPFYIILTQVFQGYDHRLFYLLLLIISLYILYRLVDQVYYRLLLLISFFFFIDFFSYAYYGYNDIQVLCFLLIVLFFLKKNRIFWSTIFLVLALTSKQSAILFLPFYLLYLIKNNYPFNKERIRRIIIVFLIIIILSVAIVLPFYFWNKSDFINDVFNYQTGKSPQSYPLNGQGFSFLIYALGLVDNVTDYYPFYLWQIIFTLPLFIYLFRYQIINNTLKRLVLNYVTTLLVFWFFSRYIFGTHYVYMGVFLPVAYFIKY